MKTLMGRVVGRAGSGRPQVTVCWAECGATLLRWAGPGHGRLVCEGWIELQAEECGGGLRGAMSGLLAGAGRAADITWIVLPETVPEWMAGCWRELDAELLPARVVSGPACMERELRTWSEFAAEGTGVCFGFRGMLYFFGYSREALFHRVSRMDGGWDCAGAPAADWLQQTRALYRVRTGHELRKVLLPGARGLAGGICQQTGIELCPALYPPVWTRRQEAPAEPALLFVHASGLRGRHDPECARAEPLVRRRIARFHGDAALRTAACVLLAGWLMVLLAACRQAHPEAMPAGDMQRWSEESREWADRDKRWRARRQAEESALAPYRMVGALANSLPDEVVLTRVRLRRPAAAADGGLQLLMEGMCSGGDAALVFRGWIDQLSADGRLATVENLRFDGRDGGISFRLEGKLARKGGAA